MENTHREQKLDSLLKLALGSGEAATRARAQARDLLGLDDLNAAYFFCLYQSQAGGARPRPLRIRGEAGAGDSRDAANDENALSAYPFALAPPELLSQLRSIDYAELARSPESYTEAARGAALWVMKMQAGTGSSLTRTTYLARRRGLPADQVRIGAKGTDLFIDTDRGPLALAEAQILQAIHRRRTGELGEVVFQDIVSSETRDSVRNLWERPRIAEALRSVSEARRHGETVQSFLPTLDEGGRISFNRMAPGGHALFAVHALRAAFLEGLRPATSRPLVAAISNGEDLSSDPDGLMVGYLVRNRIPIALVTTERTAVDLKGGVLALLREAQGGASLAVIETAQAKAAGQEELFRRIPGAISTNLTLFNYDALAPLIAREVAEIGEEAFLRVIAPDLIHNPKSQRDPDGVTRRYVQLEGAMGSTIMNLDRYWRRKHGQPLVHLIHVDRRRRTEFFSPIKSAFDYFMQFHSDRFRFDAEAMRLRNLRPGELPQVDLRDPATEDRHYHDVQNVLDAFAGARIRDLDRLEVVGQVLLRGARLEGSVRIRSRCPRPVDLAQALGSAPERLVLKDAEIELDEQGRPARPKATAASA